MLNSMVGSATSPPPTKNRVTKSQDTLNVAKVDGEGVVVGLGSVEGGSKGGGILEGESKGIEIVEDGGIRGGTPQSGNTDAPCGGGSKWS